MAGSAAGLKLYLNETFSELQLDNVAQWMEVREEACGRRQPDGPSWLQGPTEWADSSEEPREPHAGFGL